MAAVVLLVCAERCHHKKLESCEAGAPRGAAASEAGSQEAVLSHVEKARLRVAVAIADDSAETLYLALWQWRARAPWRG